MTGRVIAKIVTARLPHEAVAERGEHLARRQPSEKAGRDAYHPYDQQGIAFRGEADHDHEHAEEHDHGSAFRVRGPTGPMRR